MAQDTIRSLVSGPAPTLHFLLNGFFRLLQGGWGGQGLSVVCCTLASSLQWSRAHLFIIWEFFSLEIIPDPSPSTLLSRVGINLKGCSHPEPDPNCSHHQLTSWSRYHGLNLPGVITNWTEDYVRILKGRRWSPQNVPFWYIDYFEL